MQKYGDIDSYIAQQEKRFQKALQGLREFVHELLPDATECISYGIPTFKLSGKAFAGFGAYKDFLSFYPFGGEILKEFLKELTDFECTKSAIHFTPEKPIPRELLTKIILKRITLFPKK